MGYYSRMELDGQVKDLKGLKKAIKEIEKLPDKEKPTFYFYFLVDMKFEKWEGNYYITWDDYYQKWYDDFNFVKFIAPFLEPQEIIFYGEDDCW